MTDREDFNLSRFKSDEAICRGSFALGTACGTCSKCQAELAKLSAKFKVKPETLGKDVIAAFRVRPDVHLKLKKLAETGGVSIQDVVRQMIDFALEHS